MSNLSKLYLTLLIVGVVLGSGCIKESPPSTPNSHISIPDSLEKSLNENPNMKLIAVAIKRTDCELKNNFNIITKGGFGDDPCFEMLQIPVTQKELQKLVDENCVKHVLFPKKLYATFIADCKEAENLGKSYKLNMSSTAGKNCILSGFLENQKVMEIAKKARLMDLQQPPFTPSKQPKKEKIGKIGASLFLADIIPEERCGFTVRIKENAGVENYKECSKKCGKKCRNVKEPSKECIKKCILDEKSCWNFLKIEKKYAEKTVDKLLKMNKSRYAIDSELIENSKYVDKCKKALSKYGTVQEYRLLGNEIDIEMPIKNIVEIAKLSCVDEIFQYMGKMQG